VSDPIRKTLLSYGISNTVYIPNSVDASPINSSRENANPNQILFVGSMTARKRPLILLRAFERVSQRMPSARLVMCGDGPLKETVQTEVQRLHLSEKVTLLLHVSQEEMAQLRSRSAIFVLPSVSEGLSLALLEAMAAGQLVIASRNESHMSVIRSGLDGLLFGLDDIEDLSRQLILAMKDTSLRVRISNAAKSLCESEFSNSVVAERLEKIYLENMKSISR
jgi:glycosyltransferase involved in cell wall biosynthesis